MSLRFILFVFFTLVVTKTFPVEANNTNHSSDGQYEKYVFFLGDNGSSSFLASVEYDDLTQPKGLFDNSVKNNNLFIKYTQNRMFSKMLDLFSIIDNSREKISPHIKNENIARIYLQAEKIVYKSGLKLGKYIFLLEFRVSACVGAKIV